MRTFSLAIKRYIDVVAAATLGLAVVPVLVPVALAVYLQDRGPVFYRQRRAGVGLREFDLLKFRSMKLNDISVEEMGQVRSDHALVTPVGRLIRRLKIDELPQLWNVIRGDMSLVGPRPMVPEVVQRYNDFERKRLRFRPGMTGWAQVSGNTELTWPERIVLDVWYVDHWSLALDLKILVKTLGVIVWGERINRDAVDRATAYANDPCGSR